MAEIVVTAYRRTEPLQDVPIAAPAPGRALPESAQLQDSLPMNANCKWTDRFATAIVKHALGLSRDFIDNAGTLDAAIDRESALGRRAKPKIPVFAQTASNKNGRRYRKVITMPFSFDSRALDHTFGVQLGFTG